MKKKIFWALAIFFSIVLVLFIVLKVGFSIDGVQTHLFNASKLYIKLDTKLTLKAQKIEILAPQDTNSSFELQELHKIVHQLRYIYLLFEEISIENLRLGGQNVALSLKNREFSADNEHFTLRLSVDRSKNIIHADIKELILKGLEANASAHLAIDTRNELYFLNGELNSTANNFDFALTYNPKELKFALENVEIYDIKGIFDYLKRNEIDLGVNVPLWMGQNAVAQHYHLDFLQGAVAFGKMVKINALEAKGYAQGLVVKLGKGVEDIKIPFVSLNLAKNRLDFGFDEAYFNGKNLGESEIFIYDITDTKKAGISLNIKSSELMLDKKMLNLLKYYGIKVPLMQLSGSLKSDFSIKLPFSNPARNDYSGEFVLENAKFDSANLLAHKGKVRLDNGRLWLENFRASNEFLVADLNASFDLNASNAVFDAQILRLYFEDLLDFGDERAKLNLSYKDEIILSSDEWGLAINLSKGLGIKSSRLIKFKPYSPLLQALGVQNVASFDLSTQDFVNFDINARGVSFKNDFVRTNGEPYESDDIFVQKRGENIAVSTASGLLNIQMRGGFIDINAKDLSYRLKELGSVSSVQGYNVNLRASNLALFLEEYEKTLRFDSLNLRLLNGDLDANATANKARLVLKKDKKRLKLDYTGIDDKIVNEFMRKNLVQNGSFAVHIDGASEKGFEGRIVLKNTHFKDFRFHNQLISFIDTIPSLVLFKSPTFNEKGLKVKEGAIIFTRSNRNLAINALTFNGDSVDVLGIGNIDLEASRLKLELELRALKSTSEAIAKVPLINQIILGKDRVISTQVLVGGTIEEPKFETQIIKEAISLPFNLLKNIIEIPAMWFR